MLNYSSEIRALPDEELVRLFLSADELAVWVSDTHGEDLVEFLEYLREEICRRFCHFSDSQMFHVQSGISFRESREMNQSDSE